MLGKTSTLAEKSLLSFFKENPRSIVSSSRSILVAFDSGEIQRIDEKGYNIF
jgi:hypothetical protein